VAPDAFDIIDVGVVKGLTNDQRRNLGSIAKILQFAASNKGVSNYNSISNSRDNVCAFTVLSSWHNRGDSAPSSSDECSRGMSTKWRQAFGKADRLEPQICIVYVHC